MARHLCLIRNCLGVLTRIECHVHPVAGGKGLWTLLCAAGMYTGQPSTIRAQGPFHGPCAAEEVLVAITASLLDQGYRASLEPAIWRLHLQAELRRVNAGFGHRTGGHQFHPET